MTEIQEGSKVARVEKVDVLQTLAQLERELADERDFRWRETGRARKAEERAEAAEKALTAYAGLTYAVERAYNHGNLDFDLEDAWEAYARSHALKQEETP